MSTENIGPSPRDNAPPVFSARIEVAQTASGLSIIGLLAMGMLGGVPGFALAVLVDKEATGWRALASALGSLGGIVLAIVGMLAGMVFWFLLEHRWQARRGKLPFSALAQVDIDARGLVVDGLGQVAWGEVLSWEGIPDSESALIVHTQPFGGLLLHAATDELVPLLAYYLASSSAEAVEKAKEASGEGVFHFKAQIFSWPRFLAWIIAGYVAALGVAVFLIVAGPAGHPFKMLVALSVLMPLCAWLVWSTAFSRLSLFGNRFVRAFDIRGYVLEMGDGSWRADLKNSQVHDRTTRGIGYELNFISVRPEQGARLDLLIELPEHAALLEHLRALAVLPAEPFIPSP